MKVKALFSIALLVLSLFMFALPLGCAAGKTKTVIDTSGTLTILQAPITIPATTYSIMNTIIPGDLIIVIGGGYADSVTNVSVGQKIMWVNQDHEAHTVTSIGRYGGLFDFTLLSGQSVEYSFKNADYYEYYCKLHPGEDAVIIVDLPPGSP